MSLDENNTPEEGQTTTAEDNANTADQSTQDQENQDNGARDADAATENEGAEGEKDDDAEKSDKKKNPVEPWVAKRLRQEKDKATRYATEAQELARQNQTLLEQLASLQKGEQVEVAQPDIKNRENLTAAQIRAEAERLVAQQEYQREIDKIVENGHKDFSDFNQATNTFGDALGDAFNNAVSLIVSLELPEAHKLIQHLGNDPEEAIRIFSLKPVRQVLELNKLSEEITKPKTKQISKASDPITPVGGRSKVAPTSQTATNMEDFRAARQRELKASGKTHLL